MGLYSRYILELVYFRVCTYLWGFSIPPAKMTGMHSGPRRETREAVRVLIEYRVQPGPGAEGVFGGVAEDDSRFDTGR